MEGARCHTALLSSSRLSSNIRGCLCRCQRPGAVLRKLEPFRGILGFMHRACRHACLQAGSWHTLQKRRTMTCTWWTTQKPVGCGRYVQRALLCMWACPKGVGGTCSALCCACEHAPGVGGVCGALCCACEHALKVWEGCAVRSVEHVSMP